MAQDFFDEVMGFLLRALFLLGRPDSFRRGQDARCTMHDAKKKGLDHMGVSLLERHSVSFITRFWNTTTQHRSGQSSGQANAVNTPDTRDHRDRDRGTSLTTAVLPAAILPTTMPTTKQRGVESPARARGFRAV